MKYKSYSLTSQFFSTLPTTKCFLLNIFVQNTLRCRTVQRGLAWMRTKSAAPHFQDLRLEKPKNPNQTPVENRQDTQRQLEKTHIKLNTRDDFRMKSSGSFHCSIWCLHFLWQLAECLQRCERPRWKSSSLSRPRLDICKSLPWKMWSPMESPWKIIS